VAAAPSAEMVVPVLQTLINFKGTAKAPVVGVTIQGVNFRDAAYTFMERFGVPSGGDWSLYRGGAIFVEGTEKLTLSDGLYKRLDGNAIMLSGYNRNVSILKNELVFIGDNAIASWGKTQEWDGRGGDQPRFTHIADNFVHEIAFFEKQSSFYFQAKTAQATVTNNIVFNIPRASVHMQSDVACHFWVCILRQVTQTARVNLIYRAINFNDGFGGDNHIVVFTWI
jgi:hypothetical protein